MKVITTQQQRNATLATMTLLSAILLLLFTVYVSITGAVIRQEGLYVVIGSLLLIAYSILALAISGVGVLVKKISGLKVAPVGAKVYLVTIGIAIICLMVFNIAAYFWSRYR